MDRLRRRRGIVPIADHRRLRIAPARTAKHHRRLRDNDTTL